MKIVYRDTDTEIMKSDQRLLILKKCRECLFLVYKSTLEARIMVSYLEKYIDMLLRYKIDSFQLERI